jgi:glucosamine--fructose-6-phosphate aminotransferase (isomerizing)
MARAEELAEARTVFFVARGAGLPYAAEGALRLKEITHRNAEAIPAGGFKQRPIALNEKGTPILIIESGDPGPLASSADELGSRGLGSSASAADRRTAFRSCVNQAPA